jgi:hypothetical protein
MILSSSFVDNVEIACRNRPLLNCCAQLSSHSETRVTEWDRERMSLTISVMKYDSAQGSLVMSSEDAKP